MNYYIIWGLLLLIVAAISFLKRNLKWHLEFGEYDIAIPYRAILSVLSPLQIAISSTFIIPILYLLGPFDNEIFAGCCLLICLLVFLVFVIIAIVKAVREIKKGFWLTYKTSDYILFLRRFEKDGKNTYVKKQVDKLLSLTKMKVLSIGNPMSAKSSIEISGEQYYVREDSWKQCVRKLENEAQIIFISLDCSEGLLWEISNVDEEQYHKVVISIPDKETYFDYLKSGKAGNYIPKDIVEFPAIVYFDDGRWICDSDSSDDLSSLDRYVEKHPYGAKPPHLPFLSIYDKFPDSVYYREGSGRGGLFFTIDELPLKAPIIERILFFIFPFLYIYDYFDLVGDCDSAIKGWLRFVFFSFHYVLFFFPFIVWYAPAFINIGLASLLVFSGTFSAKNGVHFFNYKYSHLRKNYLIKKIITRSSLYIIFCLIIILISHYR